MKRNIRLISFLLALLTCACLLAACGKKQNKNPDDTTPPDVAEGSHDLEAKNWSGREFRILDANDHPDMHINYFEEDVGGTIVQEALYKKDSHIKDRYNVDLVYTQYLNTDKDGIEVFANSAAVGDRNWDLVVSTASGTRLTTYACMGYLSNLAELPAPLDLSQKWWSAEANEALTLGGKIYFTTGDIMASVYDAPMAVFANKKLLAAYHVSDNLYKKVTDGEWTMEYLQEITLELLPLGDAGDLNKDGVKHANDDFFAIASQPIKMTAVGMLVGMGFENSYIKDNELIIVNDDYEEIESFCAPIKNIVEYIERENNNNNDVIDKVFKNDRAVFLIHLIEAANHNLRDMASDYMILPMPKGSTQQENYRTYINGWVDCFVAVPAYDTSRTEDSEFFAFMMEAMARASYDIVRPVAFEKTVMYQATRDEDSFKMLEIIYNTLYIDFQGIFDFGTVSTEIGKYIYRDTNLSQALASVKGVINTDSAKMSEKWLNPVPDTTQ